jgi:hypothetical protein
MLREIRKGVPVFWSLDGDGRCLPFFRGCRREELSFENVSRLFT